MLLGHVKCGTVSSCLVLSGSVQWSDVMCGNVLSSKVKRR